MVVKSFNSQRDGDAITFIPQMRKLRLKVLKAICLNLKGSSKTQGRTACLLLPVVGLGEGWKRVTFGFTLYIETFNVRCTDELII